MCLCLKRKGDQPSGGPRLHVNIVLHGAQTTSRALDLWFPFRAAFGVHLRAYVPLGQGPPPLLFRGSSWFKWRSPRPSGHVGVPSSTSLIQLVYMYNIYIYIYLTNINIGLPDSGSGKGPITLLRKF